MYTTWKKNLESSTWFEHLNTYYLLKFHTNDVKYTLFTMLISKPRVYLIILYMKNIWLSQIYFLFVSDVSICNPAL